MEDWKRLLSEDLEQKQEKKRREKRPASKPLKIAVTAVFSALLVVLLVWLGAIIQKVYFYDRIYPGVQALNIDLGGMTEAQAAQSIESYSKNFYSGKQIVLKSGESTVILPAKDALRTVDAASVARQAYAYGRAGGLFTRYKKITSEEKGNIPVDLKSGYDRELVEGKVRELAALVNVPYKKYSYEISEEGISISKGQTGLVLDEGGTVAKVISMLESNTFGALEAETAVTESVMPDWGVLRESFYIEAKNAEVEKSGSKGYTILPGVTGRDVDINLILSDMEKEGWEKNFYPFIYTEPEVDEFKLSELLFRDVLGEAVTPFNANELNRTENVRLAAEKVNGAIVMPGGEFSFNKTVGERTEARGFKQAKVFSQGEVTDDIGGGICQVSSTIYLSALLAEMEVTERREHAFRVSYIPLGQDATVQWGYIDFKFINNGDYPVKVFAEMANGKLTVKLFGTKTNPGRTVKIESVIVDESKFKTEERVNPSLAPGQTVQIQGGQDGARVETYKTVYENGAELEKSRITVSGYRSQTRIIEIGK